MSVENRLEREIAYSADFFRSQVPRTKRYPVYAERPQNRQNRKKESDGRIVDLGLRVVRRGEAEKCDTFPFHFLLHLFA